MTMCLMRSKDSAQDFRAVAPVDALFIDGGGRRCRCSFRPGRGPLVRSANGTFELLHLVDGVSPFARLVV